MEAGDAGVRSLLDPGLWRAERLAGLRAAIYLSEGPDGRAWIYFHKAGDPVPADLETPTGFIVMRLPEERFDSVVDLLRNEEPLFVSFASGIAPP